MTDSSCAHFFPTRNLEIPLSISKYSGQFTISENVKVTGRLCTLREFRTCTLFENLSSPCFEKKALVWKAGEDQTLCLFLCPGC